MKQDQFIVALCSVVLLTCPLAAQRTRVLVATTNAGAPPVTAHRQVAWSSWGTVYLWNGSSVITIPTGGQSVDSVGFVGPGRLFFTVQGGPSFGYNVYDVATATMTRLLTNPIDVFHTDGTAAVFPRPGYAGFGLYTAGASYTEFAAGAATTYAPHINGRYVVYQRRSGTGFTDYDVFRYDRTSGSTTSASSNQGGTDARVDEAGRVVWMKGANTSLAQLWWNDFVSGPRVIAGVGFGAMTNRYDAHLGQLAYARLRSSGSIPYDLFFEEGVTSRVIDTSVTGFDGIRARDGMVLWSANGMRLYDGLATITVNAAQFSLPQSGSALDRGWVVHGGSGGPVTLRESPLTWEQNTVSAASGGSVQLNLIAGAGNAGRQYLLLASLSGSYPGIAFAGRTVPLNYDSFVITSASLANSSLFVNTASTLDASGNATARFVLPPGIAGGLVGQYLTFAYVLVTPSFDYVSNPARVKITP